MKFPSPEEILEADPRRFLLSFMILQVPTNCLWCIRYRSWDYCWFSFAEVSQDLQGHSNRQHLSEFSTLASKPKTPSEVTYKDQNNTVHTSGANHKPPSKLLTKIRTTQCTHQYIANQKPRSKLVTKIRRTHCTHHCLACRSTYHWILLLLLLHSSRRTHA